MRVATQGIALRGTTLYVSDRGDVLMADLLGEDTLFKSAIKGIIGWDVFYYYAPDYNEACIYRYGKTLEECTKQAAKVMSTTTSSEVSQKVVCSCDSKALFDGNYDEACTYHNERSKL